MPKNTGDARFARFVERVWRDDVTPLLRGPRANQRQKTARLGGAAAAAGGGLLDRLFKLKGRPFSRALTVLGSSIGAMVPDLWDWEWLSKIAGPRERDVVAEQVRKRAAELPERDALALFDLSPQATRDELRHAWRAMSLRWHPDKAPNENRRHEYQIRFVTYQSAYERLERAFEEGRLPAAQSK